MGEVRLAADGGVLSHNMAAVEAVYTAVLLGRGGFQQDGPTDAVVQAYLADAVGGLSNEVSLAERRDRRGNGRSRLATFEARPADGVARWRTGRTREILIGLRQSRRAPHHRPTRGHSRA